MTDKPLHHFRNPADGWLYTTQHPERYSNASLHCERIIPIPAALVTDELLDDLLGMRSAAHVDRNERLNALRDALIAGLSKPEPLAGPTDPAVRVLNKNGDEWARLSDGLWVGSDHLHSNWETFTDHCGPLRLADGGDSDQ